MAAHPARDARVLPPGPLAGRAAESPYRLPGGPLPQHLRVLGRARHGDLHDPGRRLHPPLRLLRRHLRPAAGRASIPRSPTHVAEAVAVMGLRHAVITSVDRDDLPDGGARHWARVIAAVHARNPELRRRGADPRLPRRARRPRHRARRRARRSSPTTWRRCRGSTAQARPGSRYDRSLGLLAEAAAPPRRAASTPAASRPASCSASARRRTRSTRRSRDIRGAGVEILTIGQYLQPTPKHLPVDRWVHPDEFAALPRLRPLARLRPLRVRPRWCAAATTRTST